MSQNPRKAPARAAVLLLHGFTGSRASLIPWAEALERQGFATLTPVLPGHETRWQDMVSCSYAQWIQATEQAYDQLAREYDHIFVAGLSMGGALACHLATRRKVAGVSLVNPGLFVDNPLGPYTRWLKFAVRSVAPISNDIAKPGGDEQAYPRTPVAAVDQLYRLFAQVRARLGLIDAPVQLFRSATDHVVADASVAALRTGLRASVLSEQYRLERSYHVATLDWDAPFIFEKSADFFNRRLASASSN